jgi:hypothetical protein
MHLHAEFIRNWHNCASYVIDNLSTLTTYIVHAFIRTVREYTFVLFVQSCTRIFLLLYAAFKTFSYGTLLTCSTVLVEQLIEHTPLRGTEMSYDRSSFYRSMVAFIPRECKIHTEDTFVLSRCYSFT